MKMREKVPIASLTTMHLGGTADYVLEVETAAEVPEAYNFAEERGLPVWVMGAGANSIGRDGGFPGVIILNRIAGLNLEWVDTPGNIEPSDGSVSDAGAKSKANLSKHTGAADESIGNADASIGKPAGTEAILTAGGGEEWDAVVALACRHGLTGIEAMSKIPGTAGAAPVQNIGAYGQELAQVLDSVEAFDSRRREFVRIAAEQMEFAYRRSIFNSRERGRYFICSIRLRLRVGELQPPFYVSLQRYAEEHGAADFSPASVRRMVSAIRAAKLPDPAQVASAGSFFKNVYLSDSEADRLEAAGVKMWRGNGANKVNAGWLIEQAGLAGREFHGFRVSDKAALILINESGRSYADLAAARKEIRRVVHDKYGIWLEQEPEEIVPQNGLHRNEHHGGRVMD